MLLEAFNYFGECECENSAPVSASPRGRAPTPTPTPTPQDVSHQHDTTATTISLFATKPSPRPLFTRCAIPFLPSRPPFVSNRRAKTATSPRPANLPAHDILSRAGGAAKHHQICKIHPKLLECRSNRHQKLSFNNRLLSASRESWIEESKRIEALVFNRPGMSPRPPQFVA